MILPIEDVLDRDRAVSLPEGRILGQSREGRPIRGYVLGSGRIHLSLLGGCHADEPVGPAMLRILIGYLALQPADSRLLRRATWYVVPHVNPDGAHRNTAWTDHPIEVYDSHGQIDAAYDPLRYVQAVVRELPGDDIEFGFPRDSEDAGARPENSCVAAFLSAGAPFHLHASLHGMGFAPGPWFLLEPSWIDRTTSMRQRLRDLVGAMGLPLFDVDRRGEKGFRRIDEGFSTRPDSAAMRRHFLDRNDAATAARFRPSSMEFVRGLGGDPLTIVSEMPLFLLPSARDSTRKVSFLPGSEGRMQLHSWLHGEIRREGPDGARRSLTAAGVQPLAIRDQMRLQIGLLNEAITTVVGARPAPRS